MNDNFPKRTRTHVLGEEAVAAIKGCFPPEWIVREEYPDYGVDLICEIVLGTSVTGLRFAVQVKGKDSSSKREFETARGIKQSTINYWHNRLERVMLAIYLADRNEVVWRWTEDIKIPDSKEVSIKVSKDSLLLNTEWNGFTDNLRTYYERLILQKAKHTEEVIAKAQNRKFPVKTSSENVVESECEIRIYQDSSVVKFNNNKIGIFDCGKKSKDQIVNWLTDNKISKVDILAISHFHLDHYFGIESIIDSVDKIGTIMMPPLSVLESHHNKEKYFPATHLIKVLNRIERCNKMGSEVVTFNSERLKYPLNETSNGSQVSLEVYFPVRSLIHTLSNQLIDLRLSDSSEKMFVYNIDHNSICPVFKVNFYETSFLITGDASRNVWDEVIEKNEHFLKTDGLVLPHHGSKRSLSEDILKRIIRSDKFIAVVSPHKVYRLPHIEVTSLVESNGGTILTVNEKPVVLQMTRNGIRVIENEHQ